MGTYERLHSHASKPNGSSNTRMAANPDEIQAAMRSDDMEPTYRYNLGAREITVHPEI
ncbi:Hypothetical predicted protein [Pelobates cultripes]|uniref:Uncharacterized protein n=1 Tax=Pelobates cultripes TaxID=61616 RepID=A0AAD1RF25_PELCU|nr:Hypothetical predicted protein [Pelobates cultripes]